MAQITTDSTNVVRMWVETKPHHLAEWETDKYGKETHMTLTGKGHKIRIEKETWERCFIRTAPTPYDTRMFRWDFEREWSEYLRIRG